LRNVANVDDSTDQGRGGAISNAKSGNILFKGKLTMEGNRAEVRRGTLYIDLAPTTYKSRGWATIESTCGALSGPESATPVALIWPLFVTRHPKKGESNLAGLGQSIRGQAASTCRRGVSSPPADFSRFCPRDC